MHTLDQQQNAKRGHRHSTHEIREFHDDTSQQSINDSGEGGISLEHLARALGIFHSLLKVGPALVPARRNDAGGRFDGFTKRLLRERGHWIPEQPLGARRTLPR